MSKVDLEYFSKRMREEQEAAEQGSPAESAIHRKLAEQYAGVIKAYTQPSATEAAPPAGE